MSTPKKFTPYHVVTEDGETWIVDRTGADVITSVRLSIHYADIYREDIMEIICDTLNGRDKATAIIRTLLPYFSEDDVPTNEAELAETLKQARELIQ